MSLYAGDTAAADGQAVDLVLTTSQAATVARIVVRYSPDGGSTDVEWDMPPASSTATTVTFTRALVAGDIPQASPGGYRMRARVYAAGDVLLFETDEFTGPQINPRRV